MDNMIGWNFAIRFGDGKKKAGKKIPATREIGLKNMATTNFSTDFLKILR
jgi:hypothetical protein